MVRKHTYASHALPDSPAAVADALASFLADPEKTARYFGGMTPGELLGACARAVIERDSSIGAQLREQLAGSSGGAYRPGRLPGMSAVEALYRADAPTVGPYRDGEFTAGSFFAAAWHGAARSQAHARLTGIRNSYGSEVPADGGFAVPEDVRSDMVFRSLSLGAVRQRARVFPVTTLRTGLPVADETSDASSVFGGLTAYWTEEAAAAGESTSAFKLAVLDAKKLQGLLNTPNELMNDAPAWEAFIREAVPEAWAYHEDLAYLTGSGAGEPQGMVSCPASIAVPKQAGQAAATIVWENVVGMAARLLPTSWPRAIWVAAPDTFTELATMALSVGTGGGPVWTAENGMTIFGRPVYFYDFMPQLGSTGDLMLIDPAYYGIADRMLLQVASSPHVKFGFDVTSWRITSRQDAQPLLSSAITPRNGASGTLSAFVQLAAR